MQTPRAHLARLMLVGTPAIACSSALPNDKSSSGAAGRVTQLRRIFCRILAVFGLILASS